MTPPSLAGETVCAQAKVSVSRNRVRVSERQRTAVVVELEAATGAAEGCTTLLALEMLRSEMVRDTAARFTGSGSVLGLAGEVVDLAADSPRGSLAAKRSCITAMYFSRVSRRPMGWME